MLASNGALRQELREKDDEVRTLRQRGRALTDPQYQVLQVTLPQLGCEGDVTHQFRLALLDLERLQPEFIRERPEIALRLCIADRYLQHVRHIVAGQAPQPLDAPWLRALQEKADI